MSSERAKILRDHPKAHYRLIIVPKAGHCRPTLASGGYDTTSNLWKALQAFHL